MAGRTPTEIILSITTKLFPRRKKEMILEYKLVHCVAHRLQPAVLDVSKDNSALETINNILKKLYKHYHISPKSTRELKEVASILEEKNVRPTRIGGTRWLPHSAKATEALVNGYRVLVTHFEEVKGAGQAASSKNVYERAVYLSEQLKDYNVLCIVLHIQYVLNITSILSLNFQKQNGSCMDAIIAMETACLKLTELKQGPGSKLQEFLKDSYDGQ